MKSENNFMQSDLAVEKKMILPDQGKEWQRARGIEYEEFIEDGINTAILEVRTDEGAAMLGKPKGKYITVFCPKLHLLDEDHLENLTSLIAKHIRSLAKDMLKEELGQEHRVLIAGLGNREITCDSVGPRVADKLIVTRHIRHADKEVWDSLGMCQTSALAPGVLGQTGIETAELVQSATKSVSASLVIVIDALVARSCDRLAATVQISNTGIEPGSGIGNCRKAINREALGIPVITIGVPTVVNSSTLVYDALSNAGIEEISPELRKILENGRGFFVSPKDADTICREMSDMISNAINAAMSVV